MADLKQRAVQHLAYARRWLERAEHAFGQKRDVRGELDLILAQAEIAHAKEMGQMRRPPFWLAAARHTAALPLAGAPVGGGTCGALVGLRPPPPPPAPVAPGPAAVSAAVVPPAASAPVRTSEPAYEPATAAHHDSAASAAEAVSPQEMRQLLRTADKALRGQ